jgi:hypothetical protein
MPVKPKLESWQCLPLVTVCTPKMVKTLNPQKSVNLNSRLWHELKYFEPVLMGKDQDQDSMHDTKYMVTLLCLRRLEMCLQSQMQMRWVRWQLRHSWPVLFEERRKKGRNILTSLINAINEVIRHAFSNVNVPNLLEPPSMLRADGKRADGSTLVPWSRGKCLVCDPTSADTLCRSYGVSTSRSPTSAAERSERRKRECVLWTAIITVHVLSFCSGDYGNFWWRSPRTCTWPR